jgi:hypothetical protein
MSEFSIWSLEEIKESAASKGCEVIEAKPNQLQVDLDNIDSMQTFEEMKQQFGSQLGIIRTEEWRSKSGNRHKVLTLDRELPVEERILLQLAFGSDAKREVLSYMYVKAGAEHPVVLFKPVPKTVHE